VSRGHESACGQLGERRRGADLETVGSQTTATRSLRRRRDDQGRVEQFQKDWIKRSQDGMPSLLPVWLPAKEVFRTLFGGD
jgi:hypothetical protein